MTSDEYNRVDDMVDRVARHYDGKEDGSEDTEPSPENRTEDVKQIGGSTGAATQLALSAATIVTGVVDHTAFTATTTILETDTITTAAADHYNGRIIIFTSGTLQNQATDITDYALNGGRGRFTYTAVTSGPADDVTFVIV